MSGVYIKGIVIPSDKPFALLLCTDGSVGTFDVVAGSLYPRNEEEYEHWAIPVPDHGDLIDRDALLDAWDDNHTIPSEAAKVIVTTIIPASGGE